MTSGSNWITALFSRKYLISFFYLAVVVIGILTWIRIPVELSPNIQLPSVTVSYSWSRTSPTVMEQEVTRKVEAIATQIRDVSRIRSTTTEGNSSVTIEFAKEAPIDFRMIELREKLSLLSQEWPGSISVPSITKRVPEELKDLQTFLTYSISGSLNQHDLFEMAQTRIQRPLLGTPGLADIELAGGREPAIVIEFDQNTVEQWGIQPGQVSALINQGLGRKTAGWVPIADQRTTMVVPPQIRTVDEIRQIPVLIPGTQRQIRLADIAEVSIQDRPETVLRRINGNPALTLIFHKEAGADALTLADQVRQRMDGIASELPNGVVLRMESDSTEDLRKQLADLQTDAILSLGAVFLLLLIFIRRVRAPFLILSSIILSLMLGMTSLFLMGISLNVITLAALTISLGMMVDNAIVVYEQIHSATIHSPEDRLQKMSESLKRVMVPVMASTLTTIAIFVPLMFTFERLRIFLIPLGIGVSVTLIASVLVSLTWIPYASVWFIPRQNLREVPFIRPSSWWKPRRWMMLFMFWRHRLRWGIYAIIMLTIGLPVYLIKDNKRVQSAAAIDAKADSSWVSHIKKAYIAKREHIDPYVGGIGYRFYRSTYFGEPFKGVYRENIRVNVNTPLGTPLEELNKIALNFERIAESFKDAIDYYETRVSEYSGTTMVFYFKDEYLYRAEPYRMKAEMMYLAAYTGNSSISVSGFGDGYFSGGGGGLASFQVQVKGYSLEEIDAVADDLKKRLEQHRRVQNVELNLARSSNQRLWHYVLRFDDTDLYLKNLNRRDVLAGLQMDMNPEYSTVGYVDLKGRRHYLITRFRADTRYREQFGESMRRVGDHYVKVDEISTITKQEVMARIQKEDQNYSKTVSFEYLGSYKNGNDLLNETLSALPLPVGISVGRPNYIPFGSGSQEGMSLMITLLMAVFCVWMVVSAMLESWSASWAVILAVPLSALGIMIGVIEHDIAFDRGAISGALLCVGVVVNNSILLMHRRGEASRAGISGYRAWLQVYRDKSRSVILTSVTTIGALMPLILFGSSDFWRNMAIVVSWGLGLSALLVLLLAGIWEKGRPRSAPSKS
jgi:hydrophobic/amphiphilic exporter-1 (mainly G- bacteria), HAE1 family